ncbi:conserved hypothetical protein [Rubrivivax sp. A210]|uniref:RnfH family protein n=1 Tax=Rubrivivax sp. A210 TaxID=2772301 RepID=UPI00191A6444|nr:RnfH family protein [Rubrivivax sp. A210]CAD5367113.1 conserved hypothetical protein [Rubrivivax sp. A210]
MANAETLSVEVAYCPHPDATDLVALSLPRGATADDALRASGLVERHGLVPGGLVLGVWGRRCEPGTPLRERDRVEVYRPLLVDPKEARRQRYKRHREGGPPA